MAALWEPRTAVELVVVVDCRFCGSGSCGGSSSGSGV